MDPFVPIVALASLAFQKAGESYLEIRRPYIAEKTHHEYQLNLKPLTAFFGELKLSEIDDDLVRAYQRARKLKCGAHSINHECGLLGQMLRYIGKPLESYQPLPLPKTERGRALSDAERERLLRVSGSNPNWEAAHLFIGISVNTTAGPKETMTLRLKDVDLDRRKINVQPEGAKNIHRPRGIPLNAEAFKYAQLAVARAKSLGSVDPEHYLFPFRVKPSNIHSPVYDPTRYQTTLKTAWNKITKAAKIQNFRMYDLRHHAITAMLENPDISEETVEDIAGHVSRRMKKRYSHIRDKYRRAAVEALAPKKSASKERRREQVSPEISTSQPERKKLISQLTMLLAELLKTA